MLSLCNGKIKQNSKNYFFNKIFLTKSLFIINRQEAGYTKKEVALCVLCISHPKTQKHSLLFPLRRNKKGGQKELYS